MKQESQTASLQLNGSSLYNMGWLDNLRPKSCLHYTVKPVYKGHSREPENGTFVSSCHLYTC
jgi:hypothetical protein